MSFDQNAEPVYGRLPTDRPHQFKTQAIYEFGWGTTAGVNLYVSRRTPISRRVNIQSSTYVFYLGRLSDGRTPTFSQTDLYLAHRFNLGKRNLVLSLNVLNLLDQDTVTTVWDRETRDNIPIANEAFFRGFDVQELIARHNIRRDPQFLQPFLFQRPREMRVGITFSF
jgi:outer membrane receptor protein involved in Fe transport